jgi:hypothetical protein
VRPTEHCKPENGSAMANEFKYTRAFNKWKREFQAAASADKYAELVRPLKRLGLKCSPARMLEGTASLVHAVMGYRQMDGQECETFLEQQCYKPDGKGKMFYRLTFDLPSKSGTCFGCVLTDENLTYVDLEDLFNHCWPGIGMLAGFNHAYITRLDGMRIGKRELKALYDLVTSDMYYGYPEEESSVDVCSSECEDTATIYATETDDYDWDAFDFHTIRAYNFIKRFGR